MTWTAGIAIYLVVWWTILFLVLPFGVRSQHEETTPSVEGTDPGAPVAPMLVRKALVTTVIAALVWLLVAYIYIYQPISFDSIPFMPKLHDWYGDGQPQTAS
ncbi:DUF1467 family protein [Parvibaculum sedimenti]|uniref:DUF1467 family protein n=1 Tax=Parvibaculum sedimenti TaxID=2608632 RepID=A0A6N6VL20_9HYPH|nr:DUF1467 family protein [Parvibaculum sedimenti]KAB7739292.1 DUF1467 family protein [Parvibaculum sedimenti]